MIVYLGVGFRVQVLSPRHREGAPCSLRAPSPSHPGWAHGHVSLAALSFPPARCPPLTPRLSERCRSLPSLALTEHFWSRAHAFSSERSLSWRVDLNIVLRPRPHSRRMRPPKPPFGLSVGFTDHSLSCSPLFCVKISFCLCCGKLILCLSGKTCPLLHLETRKLFLKMV